MTVQKQIVELPEKSSLHANDPIAIDDSEDANVSKKVLWSTVKAALEALYNVLTDIEIAAIAALTSAANKIPYFTGSGTAGLLDTNGIGDNYVVMVDDASVADDDFARFTAAGLEGIPVATAITALLASALPENTSIILDAALSADGTYSGIVEAGTAGATLAFGDLVYLAVADSRWELADASAEATAGYVKLGMCVLAAANDGDATTILLIGKIRADTAFPALTVGAPAYISETAGDIVTTAPSTSAAIVRVVGWGNTADELYFNPSQNWIELA